MMKSEDIAILQELKNLAEEDYKAFNRKIVPTKQNVLGVRLPILRKMAKKIAKEGGMDFILSDKKNNYEMIMLEGMVLSSLETSFLELRPLTEKFLNKVDNWAQVDSTVCNFKNIRQEKNEILPVIRDWLNSDKEFIVRAGLVLLLAHYLEREYLSQIFELSQQVTHTGYYVHMGNAWLISVCMAKYPEETLRFFKENTLDCKTHNKAIQKCRESYRISEEHKTLLKTLKRK